MKKLIGLGLICLLFSACSTNAPERLQPAGFTFSADPASWQVSVAAAARGFAAQATTGERTLEPGTELELVAYTYSFAPGNMLTINAEFKNVSSKVFENLRFERISSDNIVNSTEPMVADKALEPGEATGPLRFEVMYKGQAFTYAVEVKGTVSTPSESECTDPVNIPDSVLESAIHKASGKSQGDITCRDIAMLTELTVEGEPADDGIPAAEIQTLEGLQFALNLTKLSLVGHGFDVSELEFLAPLEQLESIDLSSNWFGADAIESLRNFKKLEVLSFNNNRLIDLTPLASFTNLRTLELDRNADYVDNEWVYIYDIGALRALTLLTRLSVNQTNVESDKHVLIQDLSPLSNLTNLTELELINNDVNDISPLSTLTKLQKLYLGNDSARLENGRALPVDNAVSDLSPLTGLTELRILDLAVNQVRDIGPLAALSNLSELYLWLNNVQDLGPLSKLSQLTVLDLTYNGLYDQDLSPLVENAKVGDNSDTINLIGNCLRTFEEARAIEARNPSVVNVFYGYQLLPSECSL